MAGIPARAVSLVFKRDDFLEGRVGENFIDPGHGGSDPGAVGPGNRLEKDDNLRYAKKLGDILTARGIECVIPN